MTLALATRGYLRRVVPTIEVNVGKGPPITDAKVLVPKIDGAEPDTEPGAPIIRDAEAFAPQIRGAEADPSPGPPSPPPQGSGTILTPIIRGATED